MCSSGGKRAWEAGTRRVLSKDQVGARGLDTVIGESVFSKEMEVRTFRVETVEWHRS